jgi:hypothetical protein
MHVHAEQAKQAVTGNGRGQFHKIDPRTGREPAGSSLLARDSAVRQAQEMALKKTIASLAAQGSPGWARGDSERLDEFIERNLVPRVRDFIERRWVVEESRDDKLYFVTLSVVFNRSALSEVLEKFNG